MAVVRDVKIYSSEVISAQLQWSRLFAKRASEVLGEGDNTGKWQRESLDAMAKELEQYTPLKMKPIIDYKHTSIGWQEKYARYFYHGVLMVDPVYLKGAFTSSTLDAVSGSVSQRFWSRPGIKKIVTDRPLNFKGGGKRGSHWAERWKQERLNQFTREIQFKLKEMLNG